MKTFLLLILSLMTGSAVSFDVKGCQDGWVEFICRYPENIEAYESVSLHKGHEIVINTETTNAWAHNSTFHLRHNPQNKELKVVVKELREQDFDDYKCTFYKNKNENEEVEVEIEKKGGCWGPQSKTVYETETIDIRCDYPGEEDEYNSIFLCKENGPECDDLTSGQRVSPNDAGVYWCGRKIQERARVSFRKIQLRVVPQPRPIPPIVSPTSPDPEVTPTVFPTPSPTTTPAESDATPDPVFPTTSPTNTPAPTESDDRPLVAVSIAVGLLLALLAVLVLILLLIYKRDGCSRSTTNGEDKVDRTYEEIQDCPQAADTGTALKTIYTTASWPTNPSSAVNPNSNFQSNSNSSDNANSTVTDQCFIYSMLNHPSEPSENSGYSTVNAPQQQPGQS